VRREKGRVAGSLGKVVLGGTLTLALTGCPVTGVAIYGAPPPCSETSSSNCVEDVTCQPGEVDQDQDGFCGDFDCDDEDATSQAWAQA